MRILVTALAIAAGLAACTLTTIVPLHVEERFAYGGKVYAYKQEALDAAKVSNSDLIDKTRTAATRVGGALDVYIPDRKSIMQRGFRTAKPPSRDERDFLVEVSAMSLQTTHDAVVKRGSFDEVRLRYSSGEHIDPQPGQRVVYFHLSGPSEGAWYFSSATVNRAGVRFLGPQGERIERYQAWLESLDALAKK